MLAVDAPTLGIFSQASKFWRLRITKEFDKPEYFIGQTVLHKTKVKQGEILYPVMVVGLSWTGMDWQYRVSLPEDHPWFEVGDNESEWVDDGELEPM
ncbi:hypothetical protein A4S05_11550 [Nostoc sp. KVJ20]|uniref:hypothetical protein n=1 Tax=Nostoc sp. KVJ20 TaxID=457944 RepID=UPI00083D0B19|nr:hypothetical protein [Nostoc sp. KVJ20]ODG97886.1 hypothetical protein A4S05_11550 [Nostoc sp. KVJ20]